MSTIDKIRESMDSIRLRRLQKRRVELEEEKRIEENRLKAERKRIERNRELNLKGQNVDRYV